jgi:hypothetical protein
VLEPNAGVVENTSAAGGYAGASPKPAGVPELPELNPENPAGC